MTKETRSEATMRVTFASIGWLWHRRKARAIADEVGFNITMRSATTSQQGSNRVDLVGVSKVKHGYRIDVVEVKGTNADAAREEFCEGRRISSLHAGGVAGRRPYGLAGSKWWEANLWCERPWNLWLACGDDVREETIARLPSGWGILRVSGTSAARVERKPLDGGNRKASAVQASNILFHVAQNAFSSQLPFMGSSISDAVRRLDAQALERCG